MADWDFVANAAVDAVEIVPEPYRGYYEEDAAAGKFVLRADIKPLAEAFTGANKKLLTLTKQKGDDNRKDAARRTIIDSVTSKLTELGVEVGDDIATLPDTIATKFGELMDQVKGGKEAKLNIEAIKSQFNKQLATELAKKDGELNTMRGSLEKYMIKSAAATALATAGTVEKGSDLLMPLIQKAVKVVKNDAGEYDVSVVDDDNNVRLNNKGEPMTIADLVTEMKTTYPIAFKSEMKPGSGTPPGGGKKPVNAGQRREETKSSVGKIAAGLGAMQRGG
jgi:hypothetical protein